MPETLMFWGKSVAFYWRSATSERRATGRRTSATSTSMASFVRLPTVSSPNTRGCLHVPFELVGVFIRELNVETGGPESAWRTALM